MSYQFVTEPHCYSDPEPDSDSSFESAMDTEMTIEQQLPQNRPQQAPTFDSAGNTFVELCAASMLSNEQSAMVIGALKNCVGQQRQTTLKTIVLNRGWPR
jgi:hypothetical protein